MSPGPTSGPASPAVERGLLTQFAGILLAQAGLHFTAHNMLDLEAGIQATLAAHKVANPTLMLRTMANGQGKDYFDTLVRAVTIGETYFMRYPDQFAVLREEIFPEIIARRRRQKDHYLRLWSAGSSSGEEAYSLAITLRELMPDFEQWNIQILATDINRDQLIKAEAGEYGSWSFRGVSQDTMTRHFVPLDGGRRHQIRSELKRKVTVRYLNLRDDCYPSLLTATTAMDFIFCRNVLIYFSEASSRHVVDRLYTSLVDGGYLMVGPVEPSEELFRPFVSRFHHGTMIYQRPDPDAAEAAAQAPVAEPIRHKAQAPAAPPPVRPHHSVHLELVPRRQANTSVREDPVGLLQLAQAAWRDGHLESARGQLDKALRLDPKLGEALFLAALIDADRGHFHQAAELVTRALIELTVDVRVHHLAAIIAAERADDDTAIAHLKKAVFLDRNFALGHFGLAVALRRGGQPQECAKYLKNTLALLDNCADDATLPGVEDIAAGWLKKVARKYLAELNVKEPTWARKF